MRNWFKRKMKKNTEKKDSSIAKRWMLLSGKNNWEGLMDPLDYNLRRYIIHYGEMAQASYDNFNSNKASKNAGNNRYSRNNFFTKVGLDKDHNNPFKYRVTKYLYATSSIQVIYIFE